MANSIQLKSVGELLGMNFYIPNYQRGYRWTNQQVEDLLNDIYEFSRKFSQAKENIEEFYCLQPVVVRELSSEEIEQKKLFSDTDNNTWYEVIDGQQRLTTIRIILTYIEKNYLGAKTFFEKYKKQLFKIEYQTKNNTTAFLNNIKPEEGLNDIDYYHISNAYQCIGEWFRNCEDEDDAYQNISNVLTAVNKVRTHEEDDFEDAGIKLKKVVKIIWYDINEDLSSLSHDERERKSIEIFTRINLGKIPLTNAELIKALFLRKRTLDKDDKLAEQKQLEIAGEWDRIEYALQDDDFWLFINRTPSDIPARIEFIFNIMFRIERDKATKAGKDALGEFDKKYGRDNYSTFRYFSDKFKGHSKSEITGNWNEVKDYFMTFEEWYNDPLYYHYVGYLVYSGESIIKIYNTYTTNSKKEFTKNLKESIKNTLKGVQCHKIETPESKAEGLEGDNRKYTYQIDLFYKKQIGGAEDQDKIRKLLLLFNIEYLIRQNGSTDKSNWYVRFPFDKFKLEYWDIEHINSFTTNELTDFEQQKVWIDDAVRDLEDSGKAISNELILEINGFKDRLRDYKFTEIKRQLAELAGEDTQDSDEEKNNIGNLALLNSSINRGYGNALFLSKRKYIIKEDSKGKFIPICTKNVFLKYYDMQGMSKNIWSKKNKDQEKYLGVICETLQEFLDFNVE